MLAPRILVPFAGAIGPAGPTYLTRRRGLRNVQDRVPGPRCGRLRSPRRRSGRRRRAAGHAEPVLTHGVAVGDVTAHTAVLWARADREGTLKVHLSGGRHHGVERLETHAADDNTGQVLLTGLTPDTTYRYRVGSAQGTFETAPAAHDRARVRLAFGGDLAGQNVCRDTNEGDLGDDPGRAAGRAVDAGDMIYADNACAALGMCGLRGCPAPARRPI